MTNLTHGPYAATVKPLGDCVYWLHALVHHDDARALSPEELVAINQIAMSSWCLVQLLCEEAGLELPREPDWSAILHKANEVARNR